MEPVILVHVFRGKAKLWTRCGLRVQSYAATIERRVARSSTHWQPGGMLVRTAICAGCAYRLGEAGLVTC